MQFYGKIRLYKTPLDSSYKNVYDDYDDINDYYNFLQTSFPRISIDNDMVKSRNDSNGYFSVQISGYSSMDLHDYNYVSFSTTDSNNSSKRHFAFITSIDSLNDGITTKSCVIHCKLDAWANHYLQIKNFNNNFAHERATIDMIGKYRHYPILAEYDAPITGRLRLSAENRDYSILWIHVAFSPSMDVQLYGWSDSEKTPQPVRAGICSSYPNDMYIACGIYSKNGLEPLKNVKINSRHAGTYPHVVQGQTVYEESIYFRQISTGSGVYIPQFSSPYIYNIEFTFFVPFPYSVTKNSVSEYTITSIHPIAARCAIATSTHFQMSGYVLGNFNDSFHATLFNQGFSKTFDEILSPVSISDRYSNNDIKIAQSEQEMYEYPFTYFSVYANGKEYIIRQENNYQKYVNVYIGRRKQPVLQLGKRNGNSNYFTQQADIYLHSNGEIPTAVSEFSEYMAQESNRRALGIGNAISNGIIGAVSGKPVSVISSAFNVANVFAKDIDLKNAPYSYKEVDHADTDIIYQNDIIQLSRDIPILNEETLTIANNFHYNGVPVNGLVKSIVSIERDIFDVDKTINCTINGEISNSDRNELSEAFNRGVTRWHIRRANSSSGTFLSKMDKNVVNLYISIINGGNN